jgi:predicted kinase
MQLTILIGISGAGKSTYAKTVQDAVVVSSDAIRAEFGGISDMSRDAEVFAEVHRRIRAALSNDEHVVYDATNVSAPMLSDFLRWLRYRYDETTLPVTAMLFDCDPETAKQRVAHDIAAGVHRSCVPPEVIDVQYQRYLHLRSVLDEFERVFTMQFIENC